jgi:CRISPR/Cas system CSM-associated protein Csm4 (group 5 of RAMP superfamily)
MDNTITISNIQEFTQQIINGNLVLTRIIPYIDEATLFQKNLRGSTITECKINNENYDIHKYKKLLIKLYSITDNETILQNTTLNISQQEIYDRGFKYYNQLGLSIQGADARRTLKEIINIVNIKRYSMELKIKLRNDEVIHFII